MLRTTFIAAVLALLAAPTHVQADARAFYIGVWDCRGPDIFGLPAHHRMVMEPGGRFTQMSTSQSGFVMRWWGRWQPVEGAIRFTIAGWEPREYAGPMGRRPIRMTEGETVPVRVLSPNAIATPSVNCQRSG